MAHGLLVDRALGQKTPLRYFFGRFGFGAAASTKSGRKAKV